MPNVLLTQLCVRNCPYCFAKKHMSDSDPADMIAWEDIIYLADFFKEGGIQDFHILGGEPTLHPDFVDIISYLVSRGFKVVIFTSGIMSEHKLARLHEAVTLLPQYSVNFVCNLNDPFATAQPESELRAVHRFLQRFNNLISPGFNIYQVDFSLEFIFELISRYNLSRELRLGVAHPIAGQENCFIRADDMTKIAERLRHYLPAFETLKINPGLDCGYVMCSFDDELIGRYFRHSGGRDLKFGCGAAIDIGPDMSVWSCFPLSSINKKSVYDFDSFNDMYKYYQDFLDRVRSEIGGIYDRCDDCHQREMEVCSGGCVAHFIKHVPGEVIDNDF